MPENITWIMVNWYHSLITKDAVGKRIRKAKAEVVEKVHTDITEELYVTAEEDLPQKKTENIPKWSDGILDYLDETERNIVRFRIVESQD